MTRTSHYAWRLVAAVVLLAAYFGITGPMFCAFEGKGWNTDCTPIRVDAFIVVPFAIWLALSRARRAFERDQEREGQN